MAEIQSEMPAWTKECLEFNESKDFVLDHRQKYNTKMAELEREITTTRVIYKWVLSTGLVTPIYSRSLERKNLQAFCLLQIFLSDIRTT